jgi:hypothetical protein
MSLTRKNLIRTALHTDGTVQTGNWSAHRHRGRPQCVLVYHDKYVIMEVDLKSKTVTALTHRKPDSKATASIALILTGAGILDKFVPIKRGLSV